MIAVCGGNIARAAGSSCVTKTGNAAAATAGASGSWPYPNADVANTRVAPDSAISSKNVSGLKQAWSFKLTGPAAAGVDAYGSLAANPIVAGGVVYIQDLDSNVYALSLRSGALEWEYVCNLPAKQGPGPNGVAVADGDVYGQTPTSAFALSAATGKAIWVNPHLLTRGQGTFGIQPQVVAGREYLASQYGKASGGGVLIALNARTGAALWKFNTVKGPEPGVQSLGAGSGGAWEAPLVGTDGSVIYGIGNPYQSPAEAMAHPAKQLYTDSDVNLDATTGKLRWYYQGVANDFEDHDMQTSPIAATAGHVPVVIGGGKMGYIYEMNAQSGKLIWKTAVGEHNGHDNDSLELLHHKLTLKAPYTISPGTLGGVVSNIAAAGNSVYLATVDLTQTYTNLSYAIPLKTSSHEAGEIEALNLTTGKVEWDTKVPSLPLGAATVSNDLIFTTTFSYATLSSHLLALDAQTGKIVYRQQLATTTNSPIAIAGRTLLVPAGGITGKRKQPSRDPQVIAYRVP